MNLKDAYWFSHDSNAKDDPKTMLLIDQLGLEGYGIFWVLIETLRDQPRYKCPLILLPVLAKRYATSYEKMLAVVKKYSLFEIEGDEFFFSESLNRRMVPLEEKREQARRAGIKSGEVRRLKSPKSKDSSTDVQRMLNGGRTSKVKESKVKESKGINKVFTPPSQKEIEESKYEIIIRETLGEKFVQPVQKWLKYKNEKGQTYKPIGFEGLLEKIKSLSGGSPEKAEEIIKHSISNNYAGLFPPKDQYSPPPQSKPPPGPIIRDLSKDPAMIKRMKEFEPQAK